MMRYIKSPLLSWILGFGLVLSFAGFTPAQAKPSSDNKPFKLPAHAVEVAPNVFDLGLAVDPADGAMVQGYAIFHPAKSGMKKGYGKGGKSICYGFLSRGAKWKTVEPWLVNPANEDGIADGTVFSLLDGGITKWEDAANGIVGDSVGKDILGTGTTTTDVLVADEIAPDDQNEVYFGVLDPGTIGLTIIWGTFGGPISGRELREWDQIYNTYYPWSAEADGVAGKMDFDNIATHELGHAVGLDDLYTAGCIEETMYGYADTGETNKRDLNAGDITGIKSLYK